MKGKLVWIILLIGSLLTILVACDQNKGKNVTIERDKNAMLEKAKQTVVASESDDNHQVKLSKYTYKDSFSSKEKKLTVKIDMSTIIDEYMDYPITTVKQQMFTKEEIEEYRKIFIGEKLPFYNLKTKSKNKKGNSVVGYSIMKDGSLKYYAVDNNSDSNQVSLKYLYKEKKTDYGYLDESVTGSFDDKELVTLNTSKSKAKVIAGEMMDRLGINDRGDYGVAQVRMAYDADDYDKNASKIRQVYNVVYTRKISGITSDLITDHLSLSTKEEKKADSNEPWYDETICIYVNDTGVVGFCWNSPSIITKQDVKASKLLAFDEIKNLVKKMLLMSCNPDLNKDFKYQVTCNKIQLGLRRISIKDSKCSGMYVPVWDIWGEKKIYSDNMSTHFDDLILSMNAVDGSVVKMDLLSSKLLKANGN